MSATSFCSFRSRLQNSSYDACSFQDVSAPDKGSALPPGIARIDSSYPRQKQHRLHLAQVRRGSTQKPQKALPHATGATSFTNPEKGGRVRPSQRDASKHGPRRATDARVSSRPGSTSERNAVDQTSRKSSYSSLSSGSSSGSRDGRNGSSSGSSGGSSSGSRRRDGDDEGLSTSEPAPVICTEQEDTMSCAIRVSQRDEVHFLAPKGVRRQLPLLLYLPGLDGTGTFINSQLEGIEDLFDIRCLAMPHCSRHSYGDLAAIAADHIQQETKLRSCSDGSCSDASCSDASCPEPLPSGRFPHSVPREVPSASRIESLAARTVAQTATRVAVGATAAAATTVSSSSVVAAAAAAAAASTVPGAATEATQEVFVMAESFGAGVGIQLATDYPSLVSHLILVNSASGLRRQPLLQLGAQLVPFAPDVALLNDLSSFALAPFLTNWNQLSLSSRSLVTPPFSTQILPPAAVAHRMQMMASLKPSDSMLQKISAKTLLIASLEDNLMPSVDEAFGLASCIPKALVHILPSSGHIPFLEDGTSLQRVLARNGFLPHKSTDKTWEKSRILATLNRS